MAPIIVVGHYGSGKTEFCANLARKMLAAGERPVIADLDTANPYFRLREKKDAYAALGIDVVSSNFDEPHLDAPGLSAALRGCFETQDPSIIDVGGDPAGARVLGRFAHLLKNRDYDMWLTVNANRPMSTTLRDVAYYIDQIEQASRLRINGLVNTTHLLRQTAVEDVRRGDALVREVAAARNLPVRYTAFLKSLLPALAEVDLAGEPLPIELEMRPRWL